MAINGEWLHINAGFQLQGFADLAKGSNLRGINIVTVKSTVIYSVQGELTLGSGSR